MTDRLAPGRTDKIVAWVVVAAMGATMITFNVWHAIHTGHLVSGLALIMGIAPVIGVLGMSHLAARRDGWAMKTICVLATLGAMALSIRATADVLRPAAGAGGWLFGAVVDTAALAALQVILAPARKATASATQEATASATGKATQEATREAIREATQGHRQPVSNEPAAKRAREAYRKSVLAGEPLSDRALGKQFDRSRTWGASRIRECEEGPQLAGAVAAR